jgi:predicted RNA-binding protein with TRAM domain
VSERPGWEAARAFVGLILVGALAVSACGSTGGTIEPAASGTAPGTASDCGGRASAAGRYLDHDSTTYCGPAVVAIKIGGAGYQLTGGRCVYDASAGFAINVGTMVSGMSDVPVGGPRYFGIVAPTGSKAMATGLVDGHVVIITDGSDGETVTVAADHMSGSIAGSAVTGEPVTANFTC